MIGSSVYSEMRIILALQIMTRGQSYDEGFPGVCSIFGTARFVSVDVWFEIRNSGSIDVA